MKYLENVNTYWSIFNTSICINYTQEKLNPNKIDIIWLSLQYSSWFEGKSMIFASKIKGTLRTQSYHVPTKRKYTYIKYNRYTHNSYTHIKILTITMKFHKFGSISHFNQTIEYTFKFITLNFYTSMSGSNELRCIIGSYKKSVNV